MREDGRHCPRQPKTVRERVIYSSISSEDFWRRFFIPKWIKVTQSTVWQIPDIKQESVRWYSPNSILMFLLSYRYFLPQLGKSPDEVRLDLFFRPARIKSSGWCYLGSFAASRADVFQETQVSTPRYDNGDDDDDCSAESWWHRILQNGVVSSSCGEGRQLCVLT